MVSLNMYNICLTDREFLHSARVLLFFGPAQCSAVRFDEFFFRNAKGQKISKSNFLFVNSAKKERKSSALVARAILGKYSVRFLEEVRT